MKKLMAAALTLCLAAVPAKAQAASQQAAQPVLFVGNNWDGTVDAIAADGTFAKLRRINVIPDRTARMIEITLDPVRLAYFLGVRQFIGEGHDQFVDDMYTSSDGRLLVVSRPSFGDVAAVNLETGRIAWRFRVAGFRADHMALSPDGQRVAVSASTGNVVHILEVATGREVGRFPSGDSPHENVYSRDGSRIFHASIGAVYTPLDRKWADSTKGERVLQIVDASTFSIRRIDVRSKLDAAGYPNLSHAVRPMTLSPDESKVYFQVSFHHGFIEYDLTADRVTRVAQLPIANPSQPREDYLLDSAHHGIAMNPQGSRLCVAGTMSDYATMVSPVDFSHGPLIAGGKPYWATSDAQGRYCYVSFSGQDRIVAISYATGQLVASVPVGDHPQRMRFGVLPG